MKINQKTASSWNSPTVEIHWTIILLEMKLRQTLFNLISRVNSPPGIIIFCHAQLNHILKLRMSAVFTHTQKLIKNNPTGVNIAILVLQILLKNRFCWQKGGMKIGVWFLSKSRIRMINKSCFTWLEPKLLCLPLYFVIYVVLLS